MSKQGRCRNGYTSGETEVMEELREFRTTFYDTAHQARIGASRIRKKIEEKVTDLDIRAALDFYLQGYFTERYDDRI
jgi:hypothetical protein